MNLRVFCLSLFCLILCAAPVSAQTDAPLPLPRQPVIRTEADIATIAALDSLIGRGAALDSRVVSHVQIPLTINVGITDYPHCSDWAAAGRPITGIVTMDLKTYIKNVLPNEWPNAWHAESLKAGAMAAKMFAWWRINITETYPGIRPPGVHVVDNTCDQVFFAGSQRPTTDAAIDATWPVRMTDSERVVEIHYLAWDWQCANAQAVNGGGWWRCMGQNESRSLAEVGVNYQTILNAYYQPVQFSVTAAMPQTKNVLLNPKFDSGMSSWFVQGDIADGYGISNGVFKFHRAVAGDQPAMVYQDANVIVSAGSPLKFTVKLGNPSPVVKTVRLRIRAIETMTGATECTFTLAAGAPLLAYSMVGVNPSAWMGVRVVISVMTADGLDGVQVDDTRLKFVPTVDTSVPCLTPRPGKPMMTAPLAAQAVRSPFVVRLTAGASNFVEGYSPSWQVQVDNNSDFSSPFYDNAASLSLEPTLSVAVGTGIWNVRARQYDGVGKFSLWTSSISVSVSQLPAAPVQIAPIADAAAVGQSFVWGVSNLASIYRLIVKDAAGVVILKQAKTPAEWGCTSGSCAVALDSLGVTFSTGVPYSWRIVAQNPSGKGMSPFKAFTLINSARAAPNGFRR